MKNLFKDIFLLIILYIKKNLDKIYYSQYTSKWETLIRNMFPWISNINEYKTLQDYIVTHPSEDVSTIIKILYSFYWGEVNLLVHSWREDDVKYLKWILDFAKLLDTYRVEYLNNNINS